jgi:arabinogalactan endo-1,4-beta-galactosidase
MLPYKDDMQYDLHPLRANVPADFARGADISSVLEIEYYNGTTFRDFDNKVEDVMKILTENGINYVRLRLWVDPDAAQSRSAGGGTSVEVRYHHLGDGNPHIGVIKVIAARAKAAGMKFLLAYHFSDWWADPGKQYIPLSWNGITTAAAMNTKVADYVRETVEEFKAAGATPDMIALGNEMQGGFLKSAYPSGQYQNIGTYPTYPSPWNTVGLNSGRQYGDAMNAASKVIREIAPQALIMIHSDAGGDSGRLGTYAQWAKRSGANATAVEVDFDVIGLSWYPLWSSHKSIDELYTNIQNFRTQFGKKVMVAENGFMWSVTNWDAQTNYATATHEGGAYAPAAYTNTNGFTSNSGVLITGGRVPSSPENQARVTRAAMDAVAAAGGVGLFWWGADIIALNNLPSSRINVNGYVDDGRGYRSDSEMGTIFESTNSYSTSGKALPVIKILGGMRGANEVKPGKMLGLTGTAPNSTSVTLTWPPVHSAIAANYKIERATAAGGPYTEVGTRAGVNTLANITYSDTTVSEGTTYHYRIIASNSVGDGNPSDSVQVNVPAFAMTAPVNFRQSGTNATSISLTWDAIGGTVNYAVWGVKSATTPAAGAYTLLASPTTNTYVHSGLTQGDIWWYKVGAVWNPQGDGPLSTAISCEVNKSAVIPVDAWFIGTGFRLGTGTTTTSWTNRVAAQKFTQREDGILELTLNQASGTTAYYIFYVEIPSGYPNVGNTFWQATTNNTDVATNGTWVTPGVFNTTEASQRSYRFASATRAGKFELNPTTRQFRWVGN